MKNINDLTEDCLIWLFGQFSLQELIELRKVCQLWTVIIEQICQRRKSLKFFGLLKYVAKYSNSLKYTELHLDKNFLLKPIGKDDELVDCCWAEISNLFTNVEHFVCSYLSLYDVGEKLKLMPNITTLFLAEEFHYSCGVFNFAQSLNQLSSLKHLHLSGNYVLPEIEILSKLESLSLEVYHDSNILRILNQVEEPLRKLSLNSFIEFKNFEKMFNSGKFAKLIHFSVEGNTNGLNDTENQKLFHTICENFHSLESLKFGSITSFKQDETIFSLAKLKNLSDLKIGGMWEVQNGLLTEKLEPIKILQLQFREYDRIPKFFPKIDVRAIFPNLESLTVLTDKDDFLNSAKDYLVNDQKLTCKVNCDLLNKDSLIYMGRHQKQYEIEEERRRFQKQQEDRERRLNEYGDDDDDTSDELYSNQYGCDYDDYDYDDYYDSDYS